MTGLALQFGLLALLIVVAGTLLASSADRIGKLTGLGSSLTGFLLLAGATSLPELVIDCQAARIGAADLAIGDLLGSSLFNLLILGVIDLGHRSPVRVLSSISAAHALSAAASVVLTGIVLINILLPYHYEVLGVGWALWLVAITYLLSVRLIYFDRRYAQRAEEEASEAPVGMSLRRSVLIFGSAALIVLVCGPQLAHAGDRLAEETGLGGTVVGTVFVALTTSLPEIITTLTAVRIGAYKLAAGNIFGSNCFNIAVLPIVDFFFASSPIMQAVSPANAVTAAFVMVVTCVAMMSLLYRAKKRFWLVEPDALLIVVLAVTSLITIVFLNGN